MDTDYLKLTVGDALTRGCAATATVRPADSVEYLAKWLHKYVSLPPLPLYPPALASLESWREDERDCESIIA